MTFGDSKKWSGPSKNNQADLFGKIWNLPFYMSAANGGPRSIKWARCSESQIIFMFSSYFTGFLWMLIKCPNGKCCLLSLRFFFLHSVFLKRFSCGFFLYIFLQILTCCIKKKKKKDAIRCSNIGILQETSLTRNFDLNVMSLSSRWLFMGGGNKT